MTPVSRTPKLGERRSGSVLYSPPGGYSAPPAGLPRIPVNQLSALIESLVPSPSAPESLALLTASPAVHPPASVTINISPTILNGIENKVIQNVQGRANLGPQAKEFLALIDRLGGEDFLELQAAIFEFEDEGAEINNRSAAKSRLRKFLDKVNETARDVATDLLSKYLESKLGMH